MDRPEKPEKVRSLHTELGELTYEMAKLREQLNQKAKRSNEIGQELEKLESNNG